MISDNSLSLILLSMFDYKIRSIGVKKDQVLPLMVDYPCFLMKSINYQNVKCIQKIYFLQDSSNLGESCKILVIELSFLREVCKNAIPSKSLARIDFFVTILQDFLYLQESCKILQEINFLSTRVHSVFVYIS